MIFDTHAHYDDPRFEAGREELLASMPGAGVGHIVMPGTSMPEQPLILEIAARYDFIHAGAGIHPHYIEEPTSPAGSENSLFDPARRASGGLTQKEEPSSLAKLEGYLQNAGKHKIVAVGECGLDYFAAGGHPLPDRKAQRELFDAQLCLAGQYGLPVLVHDRDAHEDCLDVVRAHPGLRYVFHCFSGDAALAGVLCGMGIYVSFTGSVTYKKNTALRQAAAAVPDGLLMVETDAPYLAPEPLRGKRCDSTMIPRILAVLAGARGQTAEHIERITWENAMRFYGL